MAIRVTLTGILDDFWGADEAFAAGGITAVRELLEEDLPAMMENLTIKVLKVEEEPVVISADEIGLTLGAGTKRELDEIDRNIAEANRNAGKFYFD